MDAATEMIAWVKSNWYMVIASGSVFLLFAEMVTAITPTKSDDLFVARVSKMYAKLLAFLKVPNIKKQDGTWVIPNGIHEKKDVEK